MRVMERVLAHDAEEKDKVKHLMDHMKNFEEWTRTAAERMSKAEAVIGKHNVDIEKHTVDINNLAGVGVQKPPGLDADAGKEIDTTCEDDYLPTMPHLTHQEEELNEKSPRPRSTR